MVRASSRVRRQVERYGEGEDDLDAEVERQRRSKPQAPRKKRKVNHARRIDAELRSDEKFRTLGKIRRHVLYQASKGELIRDSDLSKLVPKTQSREARQRTIVAAKRGLGMFNCEFTTIKRGAQVVYGLDSNETIPPSNIWYRNQASMRYLILSFVLLSGNAIEAKMLYKHLSDLGLGPKKATIFIGNVKKFIETMCRQGFLQKSKNEEHEVEKLFYEIGPRITLESDVTREGIYRFAHHVAKEELPTMEDDFLMRCRQDDDPRDSEAEESEDEE